MPAPTFVNQVNIEELVGQILMNRRITYADRRLLSQALLSKHELNEQEQILIDRVFYGVRHGLLRMIN